MATNCTLDGSTSCGGAVTLYNSTIYPSVDMAPPDQYYIDLLKSTRFWVQRVLVPTILTIGVIGNIITIVIMTRRRMRSSTNYYLAALALFDMSYIIFAFILSLSHYPNMSDERHYFYWSIKPFIYMLTDTSSNMSVWLTVTFTVERYIAVCHPMKGKVLCTESRAKKAIISVFVFCLIFTFPTPFEWKVASAADSVTNKTTLRLVNTSLGQNQMYKTIYYWLTVVFFIFIPFLLLAVFNSFLIRSVHQSKVRRSKMTRVDAKDDNSQENKITIMLIAVVILFLICQLPTACHLLYMAFHDDLDENMMNLMSSLGNIFNFLMAVNAAGNFVLYCLLSQKYRRTFLQIFCPCLMRRMAQVNSMYYQTTVGTNMDTESPGGSTASRRYSNTRISRSNSPKGSNADLSPNGNRSSPALTRSSPCGTRNKFLQVPNQPQTKMVDDDDDFDRQGAYKGCSPFRRAFGAPWRRLKNSMITRKTQYREQVIPLKGGGNKCIVVTAPEITSPDANYNLTTIV